MNIPLPPRLITRCQAITDIIESVAMEQAALGRILSAESVKLEKITSFPCIQPHELLKANRNVEQLINSVTRLEIVLQSKLELFEECLCACKSGPMDVETE